MLYATFSVILPIGAVSATFWCLHPHLPDFFPSFLPSLLPFPFLLSLFLSASLSSLIIPCVLIGIIIIYHHMLLIVIVFLAIFDAYMIKSRRKVLSLSVGIRWIYTDFLRLEVIWLGYVAG